MSTHEMHISEMPSNPHQPEHRMGEIMFGQDYINAQINWYKGIGLLPQMKPYITSPEGRMVNPDGSEVTRDVNRERKTISGYLTSQPQEYQNDVRQFVSLLPAMSTDCRVAIAIPTHNEEMNIYSNLSAWSSSLNSLEELLNPDVYEINIINNGSKGYKRDNTLTEIQRFKNNFPNIKVNVLDIEFLTDTGNVGMARKIVTDSILQRSLNRLDQQDALYIDSQDADVTDVSEYYIEKRIQTLDNKPYLDGVSGQQDFSPDLLMQNDYLFLSIRARQLAKVLLRDYGLRPERNGDFSFYNRVPTEGWSTTFTAEAYALIGGYLPAKLGEDYDIGRRISIMRGSYNEQGLFIPNTYTIDAIPTRIQSSPRRFVHAIAKKITPWVNFENEQMTQEIRDLNLEDIISELPNERISLENVSAFEEILTKQLNFFARTVKNPHTQLMFFNKLLLLLGFEKYKSSGGNNEDYIIEDSSASNEDATNWNPDCHIDSNGRIRIDNIGNVQYRLERYREKHTKMQM